MSSWTPALHPEQHGGHQSQYRLGVAVDQPTRIHPVQQNMPSNVLLHHHRPQPSPRCRLVFSPGSNPTYHGDPDPGAHTPARQDASHDPAPRVNDLLRQCYQPPRLSPMAFSCNGREEGASCGGGPRCWAWVPHEFPEQEVEAGAGESSFF